MRGEEVLVDGEPVGDVLVAPGSGVEASGRLVPPGVSELYVLHFPKTFSGALAGSRVTVRGRDLDVIGEPEPYQEENTPTRWIMPASVGDFGMREPFKIVSTAPEADRLGDVALRRETAFEGAALVVFGSSSEGWEAGAPRVERKVSLWCRWSRELADALSGDLRSLRVEALGADMRVSRADDKLGRHVLVEIEAVMPHGGA